MNFNPIILFRPVGPIELALIAKSGFLAFPPRKPDQPFFYPVLNEQYARQIARDWNVPACGSGYVTKFTVAGAFTARFPVQTVGSSIHQELWIPAEDLPELNRNIIGRIEVIAEFEGKDRPATQPMELRTNLRAQDSSKSGGKK